MTMTMLFDDWDLLGRILLVGTAAYVSLVAILRISGKRTLRKTNAFDFVVTVALGSTLATVLLSKSTSLAEGEISCPCAACLSPVCDNVAVGPVALVRRVGQSEPTLLVHRGQFLDGALDQQRVTRAEVLAALRSHDVIDAKDAAAVVLETDGSISVVRNTEPAARLSTLPSRG